MLFLTTAFSLLTAVAALPQGRGYKLSRTRSSIPTFTEVVVFDPPSDYNIPRTLYARSVELTDGTLLATWENYSPEPPLVYFPIYKSTDHGETWTHISNCTDQVNGWGLRYQPFMYQLTEAFGGYAAGTILLAGNSIPTNLSNTQIDMYASKDLGYTWEFVSHIAAGGEAEPDDGLTPVWEPFIMKYGDQVVVYYSDQRDSAHGQKLDHQTTYDLKTWADPVDDVAYSDYYARPGMTTVTQLPNGKYMMTYEYGGGGDYSSYSFPVYYRINENPLDFNNSVGYPIEGNSTVPFGSPYVTWSSVGGENGTIIVSCGGSSDIWVNRALGDVNSWVMYSTPESTSYTRHLRVFSEDPNRLIIMGGGVLDGETNEVTLSVVDLEEITYVD